MGGFGSTRWNGHRRRLCVEETLCLNVQALRRLLGQPDGTVAAAYVPHRGTLHLRLQTIGREREEWRERRPPEDRKIVFTVDEEDEGSIIACARHAALGGVRWWLLCVYCETLRKSLFSVRTSSPWRCRECLGLAYSSQRLDPVRRLEFRARKIKGERLRNTEAWKPGGRPVQKPKGMHWKTYWRYDQALERIDRRRDAVLIPQLLNFLERHQSRYV